MLAHQFPEGAAVFLRSEGRMGDVAVMLTKQTLEERLFELVHHDVLLFLKGKWSGLDY